MDGHKDEDRKKRREIEREGERCSLLLV